jgi:hypothetical protein
MEERAGPGGFAGLGGLGSLCLKSAGVPQRRPQSGLVSRRYKSSTVLTGLFCIPPSNRGVRGVRPRRGDGGEKKTPELSIRKEVPKEETQVSSLNKSHIPPDAK